MDRLIVKNFGPLKDVDIELNKINLFIGENGSGKSVLAKIVTIILDIFYNNLDEKNMRMKFMNFNIAFIESDTEIEFLSGNIRYFYLTNNEFFLDKPFEVKETYSKIQTFSKNLEDGKELENKNFQAIEELKKKHLSEEKKNEIKKIELNVKKSLMSIKNEQKKAKFHKENISKLSSQYIPAERNLISLFNKYVTTFITADIPLPKFLLNFSSQYVRAREEIQELKFLNVKYKFESDQERIYYSDKDYLLLERSSSGIQSALPLYLTVKYFANKHQSIIIEEPEQNLFPKAQSEIIQYIIEQVSDDNNLFLMTHSPYVLTTLNTLMMAYKAGNLGEEAKREVNKLFKEEQWINPKDFSAYYLKNGMARDIKGRTGLISENEIDDISDDMACDFEELLSIFREHKNDK
jgi:predicted ATPase